MAGEPRADAAAHAGEGLLARELGPVLASLVVVNATIGTGIFKTPAEVARLSGSAGEVAAVWVAGAVVALAGALSLAELAAAYPRAGGIYEYLRRAYGGRVAFVFAWTKLVLLIPSAVGSFAKLAAEAAVTLAGRGAATTREADLLAVLFVAGCAGANVAGVRQTSTRQAVVTVAKIAGVVAVAAIGLFAAHGAGVVPSAADGAGAGAGAGVRASGGLLAALVAVMWAYDGWADLSALAGEVEQPRRTLPRALAAGTAIVAVVYLLANAGYLRLLGVDGLRASRMAGADLARAALGTGGERALAALVLVSCVGGCMSSLLTGSRVFVPLASDGLFFRWFGVVSPRSRAPVRAVIASATLGAVYVSFRSFEQLSNGFVVGYFPFYMLSVVALFLFRRRERGVARPFAVPLYPATPILFLAASAALLGGAIARLDRTAFAAFGAMALGVPMHALFARLTRSGDAGASSGE